MKIKRIVLHKNILCQVVKIGAVLGAFLQLFFNRPATKAVTEGCPGCLWQKGGLRNLRGKFFLGSEWKPLKRLNKIKGTNLLPILPFLPQWETLLPNLRWHYFLEITKTQDFWRLRGSPRSRGRRKRRLGSQEELQLCQRCCWGSWIIWTETTGYDDDDDDDDDGDIYIMLMWRLSVVCLCVTFRHHSIVSMTEDGVRSTDDGWQSRFGPIRCNTLRTPRNVPAWTVSLPDDPV